VRKSKKECANIGLSAQKQKRMRKYWFEGAKAKKNAQILV